VKAVDTVASEDGVGDGEGERLKEKARLPEAETELCKVLLRELDWLPLNELDGEALTVRVDGAESLVVWLDTALGLPC